MPIDKRYDRVLKCGPSDQIKLNPAYGSRGYIRPGESLFVVITDDEDLDHALEPPIRSNGPRRKRMRYRSTTLGLFE